MTELSDRLAGLSPAKRQLLERRLQQAATLPEPVAIVGMGCRFAGASSLAEFWHIIRDGIDATGEVPPSRWKLEDFYDATGQVPGKMSVRWGGFVRDVDQFEPTFFGITPREASRMDPQQRLLLEVAWETFEHAGIASDSLAGSKTGVFVGIGGADYAKIPSQYANYYEYIDAHVGTGNALSIAANRVSYIFDLQGPSLAVDTACSSGLVALHAAVQSLRNRECDMALAGAVNLILTPEVTLAFSKAHMLSPDGRCRPFDADANGYVRGEGCGLVLVKRLADAERDRDNILGIVRGIAINQDGRTSGITAPNGQSQQRVVRAALAQGGLTTEQVSYVEAHGTGTPLGDPIEMQALAKLFPVSDKAAPCHVTSVKANIGHTETVSGIAGLIKTLLLLEHEVIPAQLHLARVNPHVSAQPSRLQIPTTPLAWKRGAAPRIAGVSSYGFGGTNAHVIIEEGPGASKTAATDTPTPSSHLFVVSAKSEAALLAAAKRHADYLDEHPDLSLAEVCAASTQGRSHLIHRAALVVDRLETLRGELRKLATGDDSSSFTRGQVKGGKRLTLAMMFTGQGSQYAHMARGLYELDADFRARLDRFDATLEGQLQPSLLNVLFSTNGDTTLVDETRFTQPSLFALEYALAEWLQTRGVKADLLIGHSVGEYVAAALAGVFSPEDGLRLITKRAELMQSLPRGGAMAAVFAPRAEVAAQLAAHPAVTIAASNGSTNTVISGAEAAVDQALQSLTASGLGNQRLTVSHAFHSALMEPILDEFEKFAAQFTYQQPQIPFISNLTGDWHTAIPDANYWRRHLRGEVRFAEGLQTLLRKQPQAVIEVGPTPQLSGLVARSSPTTNAKFLATLRRGKDDWRSLLATFAELYALGVALDWRKLLGESRRTPLPTYPFQRTSHWFEVGLPRGTATSPTRANIHPLLGARLPSALETRIYDNELSVKQPAYLADHQVEGSVVAPAAALAEIALAAGKQHFGDVPFAVEGLTVQHALFLSDEPRHLQVSLSPEVAGEVTLEIHSTDAKQTASTTWQMHANCRLQARDPSQPIAFDLSYEAALTQTNDHKTHEQFYDIVAARGLNYGPAFRVLECVDRGGRVAANRVKLPPKVAVELAQYTLHPALLDGCMQTMAAVVPLEPSGDYSPYSYMPVYVDRLTVHAPLTPRMRIVAERTEPIADVRSPETVTGNVAILSEQGTVLATLTGVRLQRIGNRLEQSTAVTNLAYAITWRELPLADGAVAKGDQRWLVLADSLGIATALEGGVDRTVTKTFIAQSALSSSADYQQVWAAASAHLQAAPTHVIDLRGTGNVATSDTLHLIQQVARLSGNRAPQVTFVTRGATTPTGETTDIISQAATVWGLGRVAALEHPELRVRLVDFDAATAPGELAKQLLGELNVTISGEDQIAWRAGQRYVARLIAAPELVPESNLPSAKTLPAAPFRLRLGGKGTFDQLRYESMPRALPQAGQVEIEVHATGLNFSDVLKAMGLYPGLTDPIVPLGIECAGVVTAVGEGVTRFQPGDRVLGVAPHSFATHALTADYALQKLPAHLSFEEGASIPIVFLTAHYALCWLARLQPGERLLIHAAAGGVGLAALQIAQAIGAEVYATVGSDGKRDYLAAQGVKHLYSSRTLDFAEQILRDTDRRGVDVVLNSLPGEAITKSLSILSAYGRFLEIGKTDIYQNRMIGLLPFQNNLSYFAIDLDRMLRQRPQEIERLFAEVMQGFEKGQYRPVPLTRFATPDVADAFRYMAQRKNTGKVVVTLEERATETLVDASATAPIHERGTYLITGGSGALGLQLASWLVDRGARSLALLSRREPTGIAAETLEQLRARGATVAILRGDVGQRDSLQAALASLPADMPPLDGVFHAAGLLEDGLLYDITDEQLSRVLEPKVSGTLHLHELTKNQPLRHFVLFSSIAAVLGSPGQGNYAAANAFLDGFAAWRHKQGLPALSINWGPWGGSGMAVVAGRSEGLEGRGIRLLAPERAFDLLGKLLAGDASQVAILDADWPALAKQHTRGVPALLRELVQPDASGDVAATSAPADPLLQQLTQAAGPERRALLLAFFLAQLSKIMGMAAEEVDAEQPLNTIGLDSLMAIELKNNVESRLRVVLPMARFMEGPSVVQLTDLVLELLEQKA